MPNEGEKYSKSFEIWNFQKNIIDLTNDQRKIINQSVGDKVGISYESVIGI